MERTEPVPVTPAPPAPESPPAASFRFRSAWVRWIRPAWFPALVFGVSQTLVFLAIATTGVIVGKPWEKLTQSWDGGWYLIVARDGYPGHIPVQGGKAMQSPLAFFPGYPALLRALHSVTGVGLPVSGIVVTAASGLACVVGVWAVARTVCDDAVARRATLLFAFFPGAFVFGFLYADATMLAFAVFAILAVLRRHWILAGVLAACATATRPNALALCLAFAWVSFDAIRRDRDWRSLAAPLLAPTGALAFWIVQGHRVHDYGFWFRVQSEAWNQRTDFGVNTVRKFLWLVDDYSGVTAQAVLMVGLIVMVVLLVLLWKWKPPAPLVLYTVGILFLAVASESQGARPRYLLTAFPLFIGLARKVRGEALSLVLAVSAALLMLAAALVAHPLTLEP